MQIKASDWTRLDSRLSVEQAELAQMCSLSAAELDELVDYGALVPLANDQPGGRHFNAAVVPSLREAARLRADFDLDLFTVSLLLGYLQRIVHLEQQLRALHVNLPHPAQLPREGPTPWREPHA
jgi:chaperone modulatory protein CbpM